MISTDYAIGLLFILFAAILWSATAMIVQYLYTEYGFNSPFLVTYTGCALFMVFLTPNSLMNEKLLLLDEMKGGESTRNTDEEESRGKNTILSGDDEDLSYDNTSTFFNGDTSITSSSSSSSTSDGTSSNGDCERIEVVTVLNETSKLITTKHPSRKSGGSLHSINISSYRDNDIINKEQEDGAIMINKAILKKYIPAAFKMLITWFVSIYYYNFSLALTSLTSSTILSNMGCVFTFLFALMFGEELFSKRKLIGVILAFMGCVLTSLHDIEGGGDSLHAKDTDRALYISTTIGKNEMLWGDFYGFLSALSHAAYSIVVRKVAPMDGNMSMSLLLGFTGLINTVLFAPFAIYLLTMGRNILFLPNGIESSPSDEDRGGTAWIALFGWLFIKGLFGNVLPGYFSSRAIVLTSATVASVGLNIMIPLAILSDTFIMHKQVLSVESMLGAVMVIIGFVLVN